ncbi:hypothetical protein [Sporichthya brevicatena]|uniref:hypothetical protein n=1 Tax=Sporichthya brevicatena TaxID=171442 RepID=UPI0031E089E7
MPVNVEVSASEVRVQFLGRDRWWTLSKGLTIPQERIAAVSVLPLAQAKKECSWLRLPGTHWPGRIQAGSYGLGDKRQLWCVRRGPEVLVIDLHGRPYSRVVVEIPNPTEMAKKVNAQRA